MGVWFILPFRRDMCLAWTTQLVMMRGDDLIFGASSEAKAMPGVALHASEREPRDGLTLLQASKPLHEWYPSPTSVLHT